MEINDPQRRINRLIALHERRGRLVAARNELDALADLDDGIEDDADIEGAKEAVETLIARTDACIDAIEEHNRRLIEGRAQSRESAE